MAIPLRVSRSSYHRCYRASLLFLLSSSSSSAAFVASSNNRPRLPPAPFFRAMATTAEGAGLADIGGGGGAAGPPTGGGGGGKQTTKTAATKPEWLVALDRALHRNGKDAHSRYVQLATVGEEESDDGSSFLRPFVRTVVFRGTVPAKEEEEGQFYLKMITDARSEKIAHLAARPHAEVAWYFTKSREQFRVFATVEVVSAEGPAAHQGLRRHQWGCLSENAKVQFLWPHPKHPLPDRDAKPSDELTAMFSPPLPSPDAGPPESFCLLLLRPLRVDHLELKASPQRRTLHKWEGAKGGWAVEPVNP